MKLSLFRGIPGAREAYRPLPPAWMPFAVGISLRAAYVPLGTACPIIALVTFACCGISMLLGERFASFLGNKATILGGLLLIAIGTKRFGHKALYKAKQLLWPVDDIFGSLLL